MNFQVCDPLSSAEYETLKNDIADRGVLVAVEVDENGDILDGHHRVKAWAELRAAGVDVPDYPTVIRSGLTDAQKRNHARALNVARRQMSKDQRDRLIIAMRQDGMSYRQIGDAVGAAPSTVFETVRNRTVEQPATITGRDGKERPATRPTISPKPAPPIRYADLNDDGWGDPGLDLPIAVVDDAPIAPSALQPAPAQDHRLAVHWKSDTPEHYTPPEIIGAVVGLFGEIDLDPCSNSKESPNVQAATVYTAADDGLAQPWAGRVYMNPPYGRGIDQWVSKLVESYQAGDVTEGIALLPARPDTQWWQILRDHPCCFVTGRLKFIGNNDPAPFPSAVFYLGENVEGFYWAFSGFGDIWARVDQGWFTS